MIKPLLITLFCLFFVGCTSNKITTYQSLIKSDFIHSGNYRENTSGKVIVSQVEQVQTISQLIEQSGLIIDPDIFKGYEVINYGVVYNGPYWLESYQVLRLCNKNICKHKYLLIMGVYA